jgi:predicted metal-dependent phosphoesterase TrpH
MRTRPGPLLAELHAHTTWSDGSLDLNELVDLYGRAGFDVLAVTDHVVRTDDPWPDQEDSDDSLGVSRAEYPAYLEAVERAAARAESLYGLLVLPGLELTYNDLNPTEAAHAVAVGLHEFVSVDDGIGGAMETARAAGAALIAAHPYDAHHIPNPSRLTQRFARDPELSRLADRFELFNRRELFPWVAEAGLPAVACGDAHTSEHLYGWKTMLPCSRDENDIVSYLRSKRPVYLARVEADVRQLAA